MAVDQPPIHEPGSQAKILTHCVLCALPVRHAVVIDNADHDSPIFCCAGCRNVWQILSQSGQLSKGQSPRDLPMFRQAMEMRIVARPDNVDNSSAEPSPQYVVEPPAISGSVDDLRECTLAIDGMWCSSCAWLITETVKQRKGVVSASVSFATDSARIVYKPARVGMEQLVEAIKSLGYSAIDSSQATPDSISRVRRKRAESIRVGIGAAFAMNVMMLTPNIYASSTHGGAIFIHHVMPWSLLLFSIPVYVCAWPIFVRAFKALTHGAVIMESLVCLGATVAMVFSVWCVATGSSRSYFDTADMLLALVMVGKLVESNMRAGAVSAIELLNQTMPKKATVVVKGEDLICQERTVALKKVGPGDILRVRAGDTIGADGEVAAGSASVDESLLSGEPRPVSKLIGQSVTGGSSVVTGWLDINVTRSADSGALRHIVDLVQESLHKKTKSEQDADKISRIFVPLVVLLALATFTIVYHATSSLADSVTRAVAVLVIACPCALGIATPMAVVAAVAAGARRGIVISDPGILEIAPRITDIVFDKTGTLTEGRFDILEVYPNNANLAPYKQIETMSEHPIARAIRGTADRRIEDSVANFTRIDGSGVTGEIDGLRYFVGNALITDHLGVAIPADFRQAVDEWQARAATVVYFGHGDQIEGWIALGDKVRDGSPRLVDRLRECDMNVRVVSGDSIDTVRAISATLGIEKFQGGISPEGKVSIVSDLKQSGKVVAMIGDGINDAAALANADMGIAMASGTDIAGRAAGATIMHSHIERFVDIMALGRVTQRIIKQNLFWALAYNLVCIPLAVIGWITPIWAAIAMLVSSLTVLLNTQRLALRKQDLADFEPKAT